MRKSDVYRATGLGWVISFLGLGNNAPLVFDKLGN